MAHLQHFILRCQCGEVISQCRCPGPKRFVMQAWIGRDPLQTPVSELPVLGLGSEVIHEDNVYIMNGTGGGGPEDWHCAWQWVGTVEEVGKARGS